MAQIFKAKPNKLDRKHFELKIERLDHQGLGVGRHHNRVIFVTGALPGEKVVVQLIEQKKNYAKARLIKVLEASPLRTQPPCPHFESCGGCSLQYMSAEQQREYKEQAFGGLMSKFIKSESLPLSETLASDPWNYRRVCRLAVKYDPRNKTLAMGFRQRNGSGIEMIQGCQVLEPDLEVLLAPLQRCLEGLSLRKQIGHVELYRTDTGVSLLLRHLAELQPRDRQALETFAKEQGCGIWLDGPEREVESLTREATLPGYRLANYALEFNFVPGDFIQVNEAVNLKMVEQALDWLEASAEDRVLDLFCGVGNFSLPLAKQCREVVGVEVVERVVELARRNAGHNQLENVKFHRADLASDFSGQSWARQSFSHVLLDPGRAGAAGTIPWLIKLAPQRILYVSCHPVTLARDSEQLLKSGYRLEKVGLLDMFPHTGHVESMALFVYQG
ncbi:23S rRNA (uracil(1939)-C(5))-methyltransferase RlmD [Dongshaea marina]|uniref:23S rRNA (uracil(1939)-C(5))-methyltransferase RlmD n=1 Tax=Dongshaea marina TaxID=2047966 RepID=UPI000D3E15D7|nr:23S rRNA (uracil(1939)-C(5))-methyltransferase RlmD [Dongshaea marina]